ncbi:chemotaxis protein CheC [Candidatus Bathyarchaeota archaeon]|nr:chemotaxis protein CheC [Candidatus Bathyarchaeota archaeon]
MMQKLDEVQKDFLKEMANIGAGNASTLLSKLVGKEVTTTISTFDVISPKTISEIGNAPKRLVVVQYAAIRGEHEGTCLIVFPRESALCLLDLLRKREPGTTEWLSGEDQDVLKRVSRSLVVCYLNAIQAFFITSLQPGELRIFSTFGETIAELMDLSLKRKTKQVFYLNTKLSIKPNIGGEFYFLLDEDLFSLLYKLAIDRKIRGINQ